MAMTFSSEGCRTAATDLKIAKDKLDTILNTNLTKTIGDVKKNYSSDTADALYSAFDKMKAKFPDFVKAIEDCSKYLSDTVAPAYEKIESTAKSKIG